MENVISKEAMDVLKRVFECEVNKAVKNQSTLYLVRGKDNIPFVGFIAFIDTAIMDGNIMTFVLGDMPDYVYQLWDEVVEGAKDRIGEYIKHTNFIGRNVTNETVKGWIAQEMEREEKEMESKEKEMESKMEEIDGEVDAIARRKFFETFKLGYWDETSELASVIATVMDIDRRCQTNKIFWDTPIFTVGDLEVRYTSPCREFETGCILVNERKGGMIGNWSELTEGSDDCELNIDELSVQMLDIIGKYFEIDKL